MEHTFPQHISADGSPWPAALTAQVVEQAATLEQPREVEAPPPATDYEIEHVELPSGGWADIRDPRKMRAKHRKIILRRIGAEGSEKPSNERAVELGFELQDQLAIHLIERWHIPYLPGIDRPADDPASMDELYLVDVDAIAKVIEPAAALLFPQPPSVDGARTPGSPTPPAGG